MTSLAIENDDALQVLRRLRDAGHEAYFAGGCVRDLLLGQTAKDYDVATSAQPQVVRGLFKNTQAVGAAFGVILVRQGKSVIEVATFRTDLEYQDGRRPTGVKFATAEEDAQRRDFTINGLFLDPIENRLIDFVGGRADLDAKIVRAIGKPDERFAEDHLRLLRAVRFASRLGFTIEPTTAAAIRAHANELARISPERIAEELRKMLMPTHRDVAYDMLRELGLLNVILRFVPGKSRIATEHTPSPSTLGEGGGEGDSKREMAFGIQNHPHPNPLPEYRARGPEIPEARVPSLLAHTADGHPFSFGLALAVIVLEARLLSPMDLRPLLKQPEIKRSIHAMRQALKISNDEGDEMLGAMKFGQLLDDTEPTVATQKRFLQQPYSADARRLMRGLQRAGICVDRISSLLPRLEELLKTDYAPTPLITGDDLTAAGASPGPKFKPALDAAYDAQLEGSIETKEQAMELAMRLM